MTQNGIFLAAMRVGIPTEKSRASELIHAIREVLKGKAYVTPCVARRLSEEFARNPNADVDHEPVITTQQKQVLQLLAEGYSMKEAGALLAICPRTVAFHKYEMMRKHNL